MRAPAVAALSLTLLSCEQSFPLPPGAQLTCTASADCPGELLCDPELGRCVGEIIAAPKITLSVDRAQGTRNDDFTFTSTTADPSLTYLWEVVDDATGGANLLVADGGQTLVHRFSSLGRGDFCRADAGCVSVLARTVRVTATNPGGKAAQRQISVVVRNAAPIADFGEDLFVSQEGVPEVELDLCGGVRTDGGCTTFDPDGDQPRFNGFRQVAGATVALRDAGLHRVRFTPPAGWQRALVFEGAVDDGIETVTGQVRVFRGPHAWVGAGLLDQTWRLHPDFSAVTRWMGDGGSSFNSPEALAADGTGGWWFADSAAGTGSTFVVHLDSNLRELERWEVPNTPSDSLETAVSLVPPRGTVPGCLAFRHLGASGPDGQSGFVRFTTGPARQTLKYSLPPNTLDGGPRLPLAVWPVGSTSDCWAIGQGPEGQPSANAVGGELGKVRADGSWLPLAMLAGFPSASAAESDGTLWVAERFPVPLPDGSLAPPSASRFRTELRRFTAEGVSSTIDAGDRFFAQLAAHPGGGIWALDAPTRTLVRVRSDGTVSEASTPPVGSAPVFGLTGLAVDPSGTAVWVIDALADQLYRFDEASDGTLSLAGVARAEDLPPGPNRRGFGGRVVIDPLTGNAATFVGSAALTYARWVVIPPHLRRLERSGWAVLEPSRLAGDPASGHLWASSAGVLRRLDLQGRVMLELPHVWGDPVLRRQAPLIVDRSSRAWVASTDGVPSLRVIDASGLEVDRLPLPFEPVGLSLASAMKPDGAHEVGCAVSPTRLMSPVREVVRLDLTGRATQNLTIPPNPENGGVLTPYLCVPLSSGQVWVLANNLQDLTRPHFALRYEPGAPLSSPPLVVRQSAPIDNLQVTGAHADESTGDLFFTTWEFPNYGSELLRLGADGGVAQVRLLQGFVPGEGSRVGIGLGVRTRRTCAQQEPGCLELWVNDRALEVHRFDDTGADVERFVFGRQEPQLDLVP